jgi:hypothetical protein
MLIFRIHLPAIGAGLVFWGYYDVEPEVLYVGIGTCLLSLIADRGSRVLTFPLIPTAFSFAGALLVPPRLVGAALGLAVWSVFDVMIKISGGDQPQDA